MYLKSLKLVGFKSFADRTRLEFRPGVTVVVGPNGSGKSNIVDAVAWVMGTQAPTTLRTSKMEDVIFAGTATRPGLGRAEVTMVLDNSDGEIPMDLAEVSITRRLYRDGSSDYEINGVACRLLDIQELLADSAIGRHQHVIIGQGQIETILNATADEHRAVIEEAAGIRKHRTRKDRALTRLEKTAQDAERVQDIIGEIERQMRPLKRQANAAARHSEVAGLVRSLRLFLTGEELRRLSGRRSAISEASAQGEAEMEQGSADLVALGERLGLLRKEAGSVGEALDRDTAAAARMETTIERLRRIGQVAHERRRAGQARLEGAGERRQDLEAELAELAAELEAVAGSEDASSGTVARAEREFRALEDEERSLTDQESSSVDGALAIVRGDLRSLEAANDRDRREAAAVSLRVAALEEQLAQEQAEVALLDGEIKEIDSLVVTSQHRYETAEAVRRDEQARFEAAESSVAETRVRLAAARARVEAIEAAATGLADTEARTQAESAPGAKGVLSVLLDVPEELAAAVDAALGVWAGAVAFEDRASLRKAVAGMKKARTGGVPLLARAGVDTEIAPSVAARWGVEALIDRLGPRADRELAAGLLGDVLLVEGWDAAWTIAEETPEIRCVTPEGDLIAAGMARVTHPDGATPAMLQLAAAELETADRERARAESFFHQARREFEQARTAERDALETLEVLETRLAGATEALNRLNRAIGAGEQELSRLVQRSEALELAAVERDDARRRLQERLSALEGEEADRQRAWEAMVMRRTEVVEAKERARSAWQEASALQRAAAERRTLLVRRHEAVRAALGEETLNPPDPGLLERLRVVEERSSAALAQLRSHVSSLRGRQAELRALAGDTGTMLGEAQHSYEVLSGRLAELKEKRAAWALELAQIDVREESLAEALRRDLDADARQALDEPRPEGEDLAATLETKSAELRRMGPVNPLARQEYEELAERHAFLSGQLEDLETSARDLRKVVKALDEEIASQFRVAFEEISASFSEFFGVLFPGGRGRLTLTDPDDPLTSGVEIEAQPMGKKLTKMTLLSGGERSLASLAFLFAVFKSRPSPFYVLDEVEAALDDANLRRFLRLLDSFRNGAQLIIVTHQQQTMGSADVLYGVTMEPGGSSRTVSKPLAHLTADSVLG